MFDSSFSFSICNLPRHQNDYKMMIELRLQQITMVALVSGSSRLGSNASKVQHSVHID